VNPGTADGVAGILLEAINQHATEAKLRVWEAALSDLPEITMIDGSLLAEAVAVDLVRHTARFVTIAEFRGAYLAQLPKTATPNRSDLPELEESTAEADPQTAKEWIARIRAQLAAMKTKSTEMGLGRGQPRMPVEERPLTFGERLRDAEGAGICPWPKGDPRHRKENNGDAG
jgi:hypothetical protein